MQDSSLRNPAMKPHRETRKPSTPPRAMRSADAVLPLPPDISEQLTEIEDDKAFTAVFLLWLQEWHTKNPGLIDDDLISRTRMEIEAIAYIHPDNRNTLAGLKATKEVISKLPLETAERLSPMLHALGIDTRRQQDKPPRSENNLENSENIEKAGVLHRDIDIPRPMNLSEEQNHAAKSGSYVAPSRAGKKQLMGYFDETIIKTLRGLALTQDTTMQSLLEEAVSDLLTKHGADTANVRHFLKARTPR